MLYPIFVTGEAVSHIALSFCRHMTNDLTAASIASAGHMPAATRLVEVRSAPPWVFRLLYRCRMDVLRFTERQFLRDLRAGDIAYLWPACSLSTYRRAKSRGCVVVKEMINCHQAVAKRLLDREFDRLGAPATHDITDEKVAQERAELELADAVFAPSPLVVKSLLAEGVDPAKIIPTSFGWDPERISTSAATWRGMKSEVRVLFLGRGCIRKGIHLLLEAWERIGGGARLVLVGKIDQEIVEQWGHVLTRPDVECVGYTRDVSSILAGSDLFVFPSLEEGGPQVSYEALAVGLPAVVSPMGAGSVVRHGRDGFVIDPHDIDAWVDTMRMLIADAALRRELGESGRVRAREFTWEKVSRRRSEELIDFLNMGAPEAAGHGFRESKLAVPASR